MAKGTVFENELEHVAQLTPFIDSYYKPKQGSKIPKHNQLVLKALKKECLTRNEDGWSVSQLKEKQEAHPWGPVSCY